MRRAVLIGWSVALAVLLLWHALTPGYVLTYDMVWVPDLAMRSDFWGLGSALPRAVPSDAVVAVLDELVPGMLLQKVMLLGALVAGGLGAARLVRALGTVPQLVAVSVWQWNPFVIERLVLGHWPVLVGYAVLPWLVLLTREARREGKFPLVLCLLLPLGSLSASAGLMTALLTLVLGLGRRWRTNLALVVALAAANAPWLVAGLSHAGAATTDAAAAEVFALHDAGWLPGPVAALGLGGTWNSEVVPDSRHGVLGVVALVLLLALCLLGVRAWWHGHAPRERTGLLSCWALGWVVASLTWAVPGVMGALYEQVPGAGLVRDGGRLLALCAPLVVVLAAHGAARVISVAAAVKDSPALVRTVAAAALVLFPVAVLPDAAWGGGGALRASDYPAAYEQADRAIVGATSAAALPDADLLVLPFTSYRAPSWNSGRKVLDPLGRYLSPDYLVNDELTVDGRRIAGENPRVELVRSALGEDTPQERSEALGELGFGFVVTDREAILDDMPESAAPEVAGQLLVDGDVEVTALRAVEVGSVSRTSRVAATAGWVAHGGLLVIGLVMLAWNSRRFWARFW